MGPRRRHPRRSTTARRNTSAIERASAAPAESNQNAHFAWGQKCSQFAHCDSSYHMIVTIDFHGCQETLMTTESNLLALSACLGFMQIVAASHAASRERGYLWSASARDATLPPLSGLAGRLARVSQNFGETFPLFVTAVFVAHIAGRHDGATALGAHLYFWGRVVYAFLYAFGVPVVRSLIWNVATVGIFIVLVRGVLL
jgi:uncharacterized MAPEG superfamily protein